MSRLDELKKEYPQLNISLFDLMVRLDTSKSYKYLALFCKLFNKKFDFDSQFFDKEDRAKGVLQLNSRLIERGISTNGLNEEQMFVLTTLSDFWDDGIFTTIKDFIYYIDINQIENKDVTSYKDIDDLRNAINIATMKELDKGIENQVIKEFEDDKWVIVRPLTFSASIKYGSNTRWCTTYQKEKNYFERYWRQGILVYFINKKTGYKFATFKSISDKNDISFWNAEDSRVDFLTLDIDDYLFPIIKRILNSEHSNKNLCSDEIQQQVHKECIDPYELKEMYPMPLESEIMNVEDLETLENIIQRLPNMRA
jgi:hypothetical protein